MTGIDLARTVARIKQDEPWYPIFVLSQEHSKITKDVYEQLPLNAVVRGKSDLFWTAQYIREELERRGVYADRKKVFGIRSLKDQDVFRKFVEPVDNHLDTRGLKNVTINAGDLVAVILEGLLRKMNQCGAIVAVCTADDLQADGTYHPRLNVLFEMGIALGLHRGLERLIVLQQWGSTEETRAVLPTDLGGVLTIRFRERVSETFDDLDSRLRALGMAIS